MTQARYDQAAVSPINLNHTSPSRTTALPQDASNQLAYSNDVIEERRYGCYKLGVVAAVVMILILVAGTVPLVFVVNNRQIVLLATCLTLLVVAILLFVYTSCQKRAVKKQRDQFNRDPPINRLQNNAWRYTSVPTASTNEYYGTSSLPYSDKHHHNRVTTPTSWAFRTAPRSDEHRSVIRSSEKHSPDIHTFNPNSEVIGQTILPTKISQIKTSKHTLIE